MLMLAQNLAHPHSLVYALNWAAMLHLYCREGHTVHARAEEEMALSNEHGFPIWSAFGMILRGWALAEQDEQRMEGIRQIRQGIATWRATGAEVFQPYHLALLAEAYGAGGQVEAGLRVLAEALSVVDKTAERYCAAELHRLMGELLLRHPSPDERQAETCFHQALAVARHQQAKSLELRGATSLSRLWQRQGKRTAAYELLAPIYGWFTEGFDTADLQEAKALLVALR